MSEALPRILPYMYMAASDRATRQQGAGANGVLIVRIPFIPVLAYRLLPLTNGQWLKFRLLSSRFVVFYITSLKSGFLGTTPVDNGYIVTPHPAIAWELITIYLFDVILTLWILVVVYTYPTGLKWDPTTIADQIAMFHDLNALDDFRELETSPDALAHNSL